MKKKKHVNAIFYYSDNVSQLLTDALAFYTAISTPPGNGAVTIPSATITAAQGRVATARAAEGNVNTRTIGAAGARDIAVQAVITDIQNFVAIVQTAANNAPNETAATTIVTECGLHTKKQPSKTKPGFAVKNDATTAGLVDFIYKAAAKGLKACYETQESTDNVNWVTVKTSPDARYTYTHGKPSGTKLYFRGRMILSELKGGAQAWQVPSTAFIFVL